MSAAKTAPTFTLCCVVDRHARFRAELVLWVLCIKRNLPADRFTLVVYFVDEAPSDLTDWLGSQGIDVRLMSTVIPGSPHCNKIAPFFEAFSTHYTVVTDCDLFFVADPSGLFNSERFRAAPNNHANPPPYIFAPLLEAAGFNYRSGVALLKGTLGTRETHINNISAGIVAAPRDRSLELATAWKKWAIWLMANRTLLSHWAVHVDQVSFALAMEEFGEDVHHLSPQTNAILHLLEEIENPYALHLTPSHIPSFPNRFSAERKLIPDGLSNGVSSAFVNLNACIDEAANAMENLPSTREYREAFLNPHWKS